MFNFFQQFHYWSQPLIIQEWQKTYIRSTLNIAPVFGGAVSVMASLITDGDFSFIIPNGGVTPRALRDFSFSLSQTPTAMPRANAFNGSQVLVEINQTQYTVGNMANFFAAIPNITYPQPWATIYESYQIEPQRSTDASFF